MGGQLLIPPIFTRTPQIELLVSLYSQSGHIFRGLGFMSNEVLLKFDTYVRPDVHVQVPIINIK